ncbi:MBL fold metallo-hydrolase [Amycolatopsis cynarae]|uniref:MBL fold metallo-hydrolase n=1 Tax=Amycolatopsis cynarae TaxID=2995223 RepID=A0ABY7AVD7_9PSEU|nr:MBL fold metallo-hydrolase [Amycolatopsis sp. HUAS 11-8]WAL63906.1 MBL fold metallo-hydrolase [Amycolatopsis sp. HUAS 11-8]
MASRPVVTRVADSAYLVAGTAVNWVVLTDGDAVTLIDAGYPGDAGAVEAALEGIGYRIEQVEAVLVTHAHIDHVGGLSGLLGRARFPVYLSEREVHHARGEYRQSAGPADVLGRLWRPGFPGWALSILRAGALRHVKLPDARPFPAPGPLDLPGRPVPVPTPGHTSGHSAYHLPELGAVVSGDALVTGHPTSPAAGPQLLMPFFSHDNTLAGASLDALAALDADLLLPGHGPLHRGPVREAVARARERA